MVVLPFVALCGEKADVLQKLLAPMNRTVKRFYGPEGGGPVTSPDTGAIVCTIEKANALVNKMLEEDCLEQTISCLIVDELHMVSRGTCADMVNVQLLCATSLPPSCCRACCGNVACRQ